jgi:hypothetical protein
MGLTLDQKIPLADQHRQTVTDVQLHLLGHRSGQERKNVTIGVTDV